MVDTCCCDQTIQATFFGSDLLDDLVQARDVTDVALVVVEL
jgi:hypothetical protein